MRLSLGVVGDGSDYVLCALISGAAGKISNEWLETVTTFR